MQKSIGFGIILVIVILLVSLLARNNVYFDDVDLVSKKGEIEWAGHNFKIASSGDVSFTENGYNVSSGGLATSKLLDINMNQPIKVTLMVDMQGKYFSGDWSEFAIYIAEKEDSFFDKKAGIALMGSRDNVAQSDAPRAGENVREEFKFEWFSVENTGESIIFEDSNGRIIEENKDTEKGSSSKVFGGLDADKDWNIRINSHVKGEGFTSLNIKEIIVN